MLTNNSQMNYGWTREKEEKKKRMENFSFDFEKAKKKKLKNFFAKRISRGLGLFTA